MKFTDADLAQLTNAITAMKKAKFELDGMEVLAFAETLRWMGGLHRQMKDQIEEDKRPKAPQVISVPTPVIQEQEPVEPAKSIKPIKLPKKSK